MIKAVFLDVDGTLVSFLTHEFPEDALNALRRVREAGVKLYIASGRNAENVRFLTERFPFDGMILLNGQYCLAEGECIFKNPIDREDLQIAVRGADAGKYTLGFLSAEGSFVNRIDENVEDACKYAGMRVPELRPASDALDTDIFQIHFYGAAGSEGELMLETKKLIAVRWSPLFADVYPLGGGKDLGVRAVCRHFGYETDEIMAFGDAENDIEMLDCAGIGVAMGNSTPNVFHHADFITADVDHAGIALAIEHFAKELGLK